MRRAGRRRLYRTQQRSGVARRFLRSADGKAASVGAENPLVPRNLRVACGLSGSFLSERPDAQDADVVANQQLDEVAWLGCVDRVDAENVQSHRTRSLPGMAPATKISARLIGPRYAAQSFCDSLALGRAASAVLVPLLEAHPRSPRRTVSGPRVRGSGTPSRRRADSV